VWFGDLFYQQRKKRSTKSFHCVFIAGKREEERENIFNEGKKKKSFKFIIKSFLACVM
jgi:hypothetical protein